MARLSSSDLGQALHFVREAEDITGDAPFPKELLDSFRTLVGCDYVNYCELDRPSEHTLLQDGCSRAQEIDAIATPEAERIFWRLRDQHPVCAYQDATHDFAPRKLSDFLTRDELHRREIYADFFRPFGVEFELDVGLPAPLTHTKVFLFTRGKRDFTERERLLLDLLRPYLLLLYTAARDHRVLAALESHDESARQLVVLDRAGSPDFIGPEARELLDRYFEHDSRRELPEAVEAWLRTSSPLRPLTSQCDGRRLVVRRVADVLVVQEELARLTRREREIVALVAEGRSNAEIAARLWLSPGTVRIHLQHVYEKLGVSTRTAAVARVRQIEGESTFDRTRAEAD